MKQYEDMVVIFLDILGSRDMKTFEEKYKIHRIFHEAVQESQDLQFTEEKQHVIYTRRLFSFSDCAYIFYKYKLGIDESKKEINRLFQVALFNTSLMTLELLNEGYLIRGGVTYGKAYFDELSFFGPAVEDAYLLESKKAITPRILIDPNFGKNILLHERKIYKEVFNPSSSGSTSDRSYIPTIVMEDEDDFILNVIYILEMEGQISSRNFTISHNEMKEKLENNLSEKLEKYKGDDKITNKLQWMKGYIKSSKLSLKSGVISHAQVL